MDKARAKFGLDKPNSQKGLDKPNGKLHAVQKPDASSDISFGGTVTPRIVDVHGHFEYDSAEFMTALYNEYSDESDNKKIPPVELREDVGTGGRSSDGEEECDNVVTGMDQWVARHSDLIRGAVVPGIEKQFAKRQKLRQKSGCKSQKKEVEVPKDTHIVRPTKEQLEAILREDEDVLSPEEELEALLAACERENQCDQGYVALCDDEKFCSHSNISPAFCQPDADRFSYALPIPCVKGDRIVEDDEADKKLIERIHTWRKRHSDLLKDAHIEGLEEALIKIKLERERRGIAESTKCSMMLERKEEKKQETWINWIKRILFGKEEEDEDEEVGEGPDVPVQPGMSAEEELEQWLASCDERDHEVYDMWLEEDKECLERCGE